MRKIILIALTVFLASCAALERGAELANNSLALRLGTAEYIDGDQYRAALVVHWVDTATQALDGAGGEVPLSALTKWANDNIPWERMSPAQQILADELLTYAQRRINLEIEAGVLSPQAVQDIRDILETIRNQALRQLNRDVSQRALV